MEVAPRKRRGKKHPTRQGKFAPPGKPSLRGATATKQSISPQAALWIASRSLSSGAHSRGPLARNDDFGNARATNRPDGQISWRNENLSSPTVENISLSPSGKSVLPARPVLSRQEGRIASRHERGMGCGGRGSVGAQSDRGAGFACERCTARRTNGAVAYGKTVWSRHPLLVPSCRWLMRSNRIVSASSRQRR
jgi:hypothetical protein